MDRSLLHNHAHYWLEQDILDGKWEPLAIKKV
jgi:hypothetical protein